MWRNGQTFTKQQQFLHIPKFTSAGCDSLGKLPRGKTQTCIYLDICILYIIIHVLYIYIYLTSIYIFIYIYKL